MAAWDIFGSLLDILVGNFFGSYTIFGLIVLAFVLVGSLGVGLPLKYSIPLILPLAAGISAAGYFGANPYILSLILIVVGLLYSFTVLRLTS